MVRLIAVFRLMLAILIGAAVVTTVVDAYGTGPVNPFNLFGYFTIQSNIAVTLVLLISALIGLRGALQPGWVQLLRAAATTYIAIVGIVYALLLAPLGEAGGAPIPWANTVLHIVAPIVVVLDWLLIGDRARMPLSRVLLILIYPIAWSAVVLVRGATDGWVPYPFLDPATGYGSVFVHVGLIAAAFLAMGLLVLAATRFPGFLLTPNAAGRHSRR